MQSNQAEGRVIGSLIEKQLTTPQQYPLTLNALVLACNQVSNREPVVAYEERIVADALASLKAAGLVRYVHPSHGRSVVRYEQLLGERLALDDQQLALVGALLLRGPQTSGELRSRTERMCSFSGIPALEAELEHLSRRDEPLVGRLPRRPGQKEERWAQLIAEPGATLEVVALSSSGGGDGVRTALPEGAPGEVGIRGEVDALRAEVAQLGTVVAQLHGEVARLGAQLAQLLR